VRRSVISCTIGEDDRTNGVGSSPGQGCACRSPRRKWQMRGNELISMGLRVTVHAKKEKISPPQGGGFRRRGAEPCAGEEEAPERELLMSDLPAGCRSPENALPCPVCWNGTQSSGSPLLSR
jgi:hypothetical protein